MLCIALLLQSRHWSAGVCSCTHRVRSSTACKACPLASSHSSESCDSMGEPSFPGCIMQHRGPHVDRCPGGAVVSMQQATHVCEGCSGVSCKARGDVGERVPSAAMLADQTLGRHLGPPGVRFPLCRPGQGLSSIDSGWDMGLVVWYQISAADRQWLHLALCPCCCSRGGCRAAAGSAGAVVAPLE